MEVLDWTIVIACFLLMNFFDWGMIMEVLKMAPADESGRRWGWLKATSRG